MWNEWRIIYEDAWTTEFSAIVRKRIPYSKDNAQEVMDEVRQELAIKLHTLDNVPNSVNAYLRTAFRNTLEDYLRKKEGYPRPPEWIKRLGAAYERIYKLLCLENRAVNDIHAMLESLYQYTFEFVEQVISEVRAGVVNCGSWRHTVSIDAAVSDVETASMHSQLNQSPESILEDMDSTAVFATILGQQASGHSEKIIEILSLLGQCQINDDERILLRLVYADGHSISEAARLIKIKDAEARKRLKSVYQRLKQVLTGAGITEL